MIVVNQTMSKKNLTPIQINIFINFVNTIFFFIILNLFFKIDFKLSIEQNRVLKEVLKNSKDFRKYK